MKSKNNKNKNTQLSLKDITIFLTIFLFLIFCTIIYIFKTGDNFSIPQYSYSKDIFSQIEYRELLAGNKVQGKLTTAENNLGIVAIKFNNFNRLNTDSIVFRIKEISQKDWYYQRSYNSREFGGYSYFPFGFPIIKDSKGKSYVFELESLQGKPGNAIAVAEISQNVISKHKFTKTELLSSKTDLLRLLIVKIFHSLGREDVIKFYVISNIFIFSLLYLLNYRKKLSSFVFKLKISNKLNNLVNYFFKFFPKLRIFIIPVFRVIKYLYRKLLHFYQWANK